MLIPLGQAELKREGSDVTIICYAQTVPMALAAAEALEEEEISAEVLDLRSIKPLDMEAILEFGREDAPRRDCRTGPAVLRYRLGALLPHPEGNFRRAGRADRARRAGRCADAV